MTCRISLATQFSGNYSKLKRTIKQVLNQRQVGHILQTTQVGDGQKHTSLFMEGEETALYAVKAELVSHLQSVFPDIAIREWQELASDFPIEGSHVAPTPGCLSRESSGFVEELAECSNAQLPRPSNWKEYFDSGFIQVVTAIQNGRQVAYEIQSSLGSINEKFVHITYKSKTAHMNIGACISWSQVKQVIEKCQLLDIKKPIAGIYSLVDGKKSYESDRFGLKAEGHYYIETEDDLAPPKFTTMEEFFGRLKTEEDLDDEEIDIIKDCFTKQKLKIKQLMATGDLAMTDEKLKEIGISQLGLRTAILAVIKSNQ
ncbi:expressed protein [Batrachochytrium dendrobatidis JAM81]|uniref:Expressed protein n=2 Tax=Batrachochytrium dendrobatidis TaxID=109871 RepID=F4PEI9_BATDJ|nr:uncharacterized protein BATDEDRAFT_36290 [Batrachochytrium dendrobatidis JAM81]EGF76381.1 expressed protein [Batrachochytrium dendrobatidis JAM81]KAK5672364.1 hypothetical protein QVD99_001130 [Batrachochytrium dendrobatidis]OAJ45360.1 hypothetical protein BDEG_28507 [Batrachochytrium dendrobatidis JEL423]|eukprot:XP_006682992.1 expressed protein [Batrachochytrium dendrobatidis JAM81]